MQILASSLIGTANTFLHAGYISAQPSENPFSLSCNVVEKVSDVLPGALLAEGSIASLAETGNAAVSVAGNSNNLTALVLGAVCFFGSLAGIYIYRAFRERDKLSPG